MLSGTRPKINGHSVEELTSLPPPRSIEEEESIVGAILADVAALDEIGDALAPVDFSSTYLAQLFVALLDLHADKQALTVVNLVDAVRGKSDADDAYMLELINRCMDYASSWSNLKPNVATIIDRANQRRLLTEARQAVHDILKGGCDTEALAGRLTGTIERLKSVTVKSEFPTLTSRELNEGDFRLDYLIPGVLVKGQPAILAGPKKCLKTNILIDLTLSLSSGAKFLNEFFVTGPVRTALISGESGKSTIQETARRVAKSKAWRNLSDYPDALFCFNLPMLGEPSTARKITSYVKQHKLDVLIMDPVYLMLGNIGESASNLFTVGRVLSDLSRVIEETGCTIVLAHHARKNTLNPFDPPELESISWAGFQEWARQWLLLGRRVAYNPDNGGQHELWLAAGGSAGHSGLWAVDIEEGTRQDSAGRRWEVDVAKPSDVRQREAASKADEQEQQEQERRDQDIRKALDAYRSFPDGETKSTVRDKARLNGTRFNAAHAELLSGGFIESHQIQKNTRREAGFRLTESGRTRSDTVGQTGLSPTSPDVVSGGGRTNPPFIGGCPSDQPPPDNGESEIPTLEDCDVFGPTS